MKASKRWIYFVSYSAQFPNGHGFGSYEATLDREITSIEHVRAMEQFLNESVEVSERNGTALVLNYQLLRVER